MARPIRVEFEGAVYHITARGNERRRTFWDDEDRKLFLATLEQTVQQYGLRVHGYCLMPNHYHLLVETPRGNLSRAVGWLQTTYTIRFNRRHRRCGHLFQGRFKAHLVEADSYAMALIRYVHLNPVRPRNKSAAVPKEHREALENYSWSSHRCFLGLTQPPGWLSVDWLSYFGRTRAVAQAGYAQFVEEAFESAIESPWNNLRAGVVLGGDDLLARVKGLLGRKSGTQEVAWVARVESAGQRESAADGMACLQSERLWKSWVRARLGGERHIDIARSLGYKDGSAISHILKRLESNPAASQRISALTKEFDSILSCFKS